VRRGKPRVIYPRSYAVARLCPPLMRWATDTFSPMPRRAKR